MYFFAGFEAASQDILEYVGQEAASEDAEKEAKNETLEYRDRFICVSSLSRDIQRFQHQCNK